MNNMIHSSLQFDSGFIYIRLGEGDKGYMKIFYAAIKKHFNLFKVC